MMPKGFKPFPLFKPQDEDKLIVFKRKDGSWGVGNYIYTYNTFSSTEGRFEDDVVSWEFIELMIEAYPALNPVENQ